MTTGAPPVPRLDAGRLERVRELGDGGQGRVWLVRLPGDPGRLMAFKEYRPDSLARLDEASFESLAGLPGEVDESTRDWLHERTAWPDTVVTRDGAMCGFLMPLAPRRFTARLRLPTGYKTQLLAMEYLLNPVDYLVRTDIRVTERHRVLLLADLAATLGRLHAAGVVVGDLSPKNVLVDLDSTRCFLIDCDAMCRDGLSPLPQIETPDWAVPAGERLGTVEADRYKFGLLLVRLLLSDQSARETSTLTGRYPELAALARRCLAGAPHERPAPGAWIEALGRALPSTSTAVPTLYPPTPPGPPVARPRPPQPVARPAVPGRPPGRPLVSGQGVQWAAVVAAGCIAGLVLLVALFAYLLTVR
jgi:DNA-binding helix-hairpin-helix protein with protein kinase domain